MTVSLAEQIAAVKAHAERAAAYAASPAVTALPLMAARAAAERDALLAALVTLEGSAALRLRAEQLLAEIDRRVDHEERPVDKYVVPWSMATALREALVDG